MAGVIWLCFRLRSASEATGAHAGRPIRGRMEVCRAQELSPCLRKLPEPPTPSPLPARS